jgi:HPt (histidine-containing phosphotransfer) domain-containing protein
MPAFDPRVLLDEYGDEGLVRDLAKLLVETVPVQVDAVRSALDARDGSALRAAAHKLRGSIVSFGVPETVDTARRLEAMGASGDLADADALVPQLAADVKSLCTSAKAWLDSH